MHRARQQAHKRVLSSDSPQPLTCSDLLLKRKGSSSKMQLTLLILAVGLAHADSQIDPSEVTGELRSISIAADNLGKIKQGGPMRVYFREVECLDGCKKLSVTFYDKKDGKCNKFTVVGELDEEKGVYVADYEGKNEFKIIGHKADIVAFQNHNVDGEGQETNVILVAGKRDSLTAEEQQKFAELAESKGIPKENIIHLVESDTCPQ